MSIESAIENELNSITELAPYYTTDTPPKLKRRIFPGNAQKITDTPYLIYENSSTNEEYILNGVTGSHTTIFDFNLYCNSYSDLKLIGPKIREKLLSLFQTNVGGFFIQSVNLETRDLYESTVNLHRTVFEFEIYY